ncbi:MAG TPA: DUF4142 domain-containing protein [Chitinophagales bacterium]|nr:DUF4142 domain-containing protein [Chitinophagales bacterium]
MMKLILLVLLTSVVISCNQHSQILSQSNTDDQTAASIDTVAKQFLIDITNSAWFQSEMAQVALKKSHDTAILSLARTITKQYTRIKDRTKIVSIPHKLNMPYFLLPDQNAKVTELKGVKDDSFDHEFISHIRENDSMILKMCDDFQSSPDKPSDVMQLIEFIRSTVQANQSKMQSMP